jgi:hypothetical protein
MIVALSAGLHVAVATAMRVVHVTADPAVLVATLAAQVTATCAILHAATVHKVIALREVIAVLVKKDAVAAIENTVMTLIQNYMMRLWLKSIALSKYFETMSRWMKYCLSRKTASTAVFSTRRLLIWVITPSRLERVLIVPCE